MLKWRRKLNKYFFNKINAIGATRLCKYGGTFSKNLIEIFLKYLNKKSHCSLKIAKSNKYNFISATRLQLLILYVKFKAFNRVKTKWNKAWSEMLPNHAMCGRFAWRLFCIRQNRIAKGRLKLNLSHRLWIKPIKCERL